MYRIEEQIRERLIKKARVYSKDELNLFVDETGWEDWMNDFTEAEDGETITEAEEKEINKILAEIFAEAHPARDFEILKKVIRHHESRKRSDEGWLVRYDGELYFVFGPDEKFSSIDECVYWTLDIERHWCFDEVDEEVYHFYDVEGFMRRLDLESYTKKAD